MLQLGPEIWIKSELPPFHDKNKNGLRMSKIVCERVPASERTPNFSVNQTYALLMPFCWCNPNFRSHKGLHIHLLPILTLRDWPDQHNWQTSLKYLSLLISVTTLLKQLQQKQLVRLLHYQRIDSVKEGRCSLKEQAGRVILLQWQRFSTDPTAKRSLQVAMNVKKVVSRYEHN